MAGVDRSAENRRNGRTGRRPASSNAGARADVSAESAEGGGSGGGPCGDGAGGPAGPRTDHVRFVWGIAADDHAAVAQAAWVAGGGALVLLPIGSAGEEFRGTDRDG